MRESLIQRVTKKERLDQPAEPRTIPTRLPLGIQVVRAGSGEWVETGVPGVRCKVLAIDEEQRVATMLVRRTPGASYPSHHHAGVEQCYVLEGDLSLGDVTLHAGDYQRAVEDSDHAVQSTADGCLLLVSASQDDEVVSE
jgi:anti-sigma factor ChrR (cupin superfamily)